jgi:hypothetical protein
MATGRLHRAGNFTYAVRHTMHTGQLTKDGVRPQPKVASVHVHIKARCVTESTVMEVLFVLRIMIMSVQHVLCCACWDFSCEQVPDFQNS